MEWPRFVKRHQLFTILLVSFVLSFSFFGNGIGGDFVLDDTVVVEKRGDLKDASNFWNLLASPYHQNAPYTGLYRPITMMSYALNFALFGQDPVGFHVVNIIIHAIAVWLVVVILRQLVPRGPLPYLAGLLFLVHPIHTEAVTSIVGRAELLAFCFGLTAIYFSLRGSLWLGATTFLLALLSKESAVAILPIIVYLWHWRQQVAWPVIFKRGIKLVGALGVYLLLRYWVLGVYTFHSAAVSFIENPLAFMPWTERIANSLKILTLYLFKLVWPVQLSADYSYNSIPLVSSLFSSWQAMAGLLALLTLVALLIFGRRGLVGWATVCFLFPYLVISNLIFPIGTIMGERLMYFPSLGLVVLVAWALLRLHWRVLGLALYLFLVVASGVLTVQRNRDWLTSERLFNAAVTVTSNGLVTKTALAAHNLEKGELAEAGVRLAEAEAIYADYAPLQNLMGIAAAKAGNLAEAERRYLQTIKLNPRTLHARNNLVDLYLQKKNYPAAAQQLEEVITLGPNRDTFIQYGYVLLALGRSAEAIILAQDQLVAQKDLHYFTILGTAYFIQQDYPAALIHLRQSQALGNSVKEVAEMIKQAEQRLK